MLLELYDCDPEAINNLEVVKASMVEAAKRAQQRVGDEVRVGSLAALVLLQILVDERAVLFQDLDGHVWDFHAAAN